MSKTKNVPKLTSKISSSMKVTCGPGAVSHNGTSGVGPTAPVADEPPASAIDTPTTPATGTAFFRCFCFARDIVETSTLWHELSPQHCSYAFRGHLARPIRTPTGHPQEWPAHGHLRGGQEGARREFPPSPASRVEAAQRHQSTWLACGSNKRHVRACLLTGTRPQLQIWGSLHHGRSST